VSGHKGWWLDLALVRGMATHTAVRVDNGTTGTNFIVRLPNQLPGRIAPVDERAPAQRSTVHASARPVLYLSTDFGLLGSRRGHAGVVVTTLDLSILFRLCNLSRPDLDASSSSTSST
jgi:hypothetical protein